MKLFYNAHLLLSFHSSYVSIFFPQKIIQSIAIDSNDLWEDVHMICPNQCVCQRSPYMDLSVSRWIQSQKGDKTHSGLLKSKQSDMGDDNDNDHLTAENENEVKQRK